MAFRTSRKTPRRVLASAALACTACAALCVSDHAAAEHNGAYNEGAWFVNITHMPDLDQRRAQLPGFGNAYCVPTAAMNLFTYFALHGGENPPGIANWRSFEGHNTMTGLLNILGNAMNTDPNTGTSSDDVLNGYDTWLPSNRFDIVQFKTSWTWSPRHDHIGIHSALYGGYANIGIGWYSGTGTNITRNNGHAVTVIKAARSGSDRVISIRDPASDEGFDWVQSPYTKETYSITEVNRRPTFGGQQLDTRTMSRIDGYMSGNLQGYMDGLIVVTPKFALTETENHGFVLNREAVIDDGQDITIEFQPFTERRICEARYGSDGQIIFVLCLIDTEDLAEIVIGHPGSQFEVVALDEVEFNHLVDIIPGLDRRLFLLDREVGLIDMNTEFMTLNATRSIPFSPNVDSITLDEPEDSGADGHIWAISVASSTIMRADAGDIANGNVFVYEIQAAWNLPIGLQIESIPNMYGTFVGWKPGDNRLWRLQIVGELLHIMSETQMPWTIDSVSLDDRGRVLVSADNAIHEYTMNESGELEDALDPMFEDVESNGFVLLSRSWNNFDPELHLGPAWNQTLPTLFGEEIEDCIADINGDDMVDVEDLLELLSAWGTDDPFADFAPDFGDGIVDVNDLLELLQYWGDC